MKFRKHLNGDVLIQAISKQFFTIKDHRNKNVDISINDALMSAFAMLSLKYPSLLKFDEDRRKSKKARNLKSVYQIEKIPSDTQMREIIDQISPASISKIYKLIFNQIQRGKVLTAYSFMERRNHEHIYIVDVDGTGYFSSHEIHCENCLQSIRSDTGEILYQHKMLGASIVHPSLKTVIPLAPEPIIKQDGQTKNDCEQVAFKRFIKKFREDHPKLNVIFNLDALYANSVILRHIKDNKAHYIIVVKESSNKSLFKSLNGSDNRGHVHSFEETQIVGKKVKKSVTKKYRYRDGCHLNQKEINRDALVNFLEYWEITKWHGKNGPQKKEQHFAWITDLRLTRDSVRKIAKGGRSRWKIENETFNTLKNQGYNFEHNYGHGNKNLSTNLALLMMVVFLFDQVQELTSKRFQRALKSLNAKYVLWQEMRFIFRRMKIDNWNHLLELLYDDDEICDSS